MQGFSPPTTESPSFQESSSSSSYRPERNSSTPSRIDRANTMPAIPGTENQRTPSRRSSSRGTTDSEYVIPRGSDALSQAGSHPSMGSAQPPVFTGGSPSDGGYPSGVRAPPGLSLHQQNYVHNYGTGCRCTNVREKLPAEQFLSTE